MPLIRRAGPRATPVGPRHPRPSRRILLSLIAVLGLLVALPLASSPPASAAPGDREIPPPVEVALTVAGFEPSAAALTIGQTLVVRNDTAVDQVVAAASGVVDSGAIPPAGRFVVAFPAAGQHDLSDGAGGHHLAVTVGLLQIPGNPLSPVTTAIPDQPAAPVESDPHPDLGILVARNRVLLSFTANATIGQANDALGAANLTIVGGYPRFGILVAEVAGNPTPSDPRSIQPALDAARAKPGIDAAAFDMGMERENSLPRPAQPDPGASSGQPYVWDGTTGTDGEARGSGGNWGLESSRFPQAWNGADLPRRRPAYNEPLPETVVLDSGFFADHPDLAGATVHGDLCATTTAGRLCTENFTSVDPADRHGPHGTATAGIIGAAFDRGPDGVATSQGTVGANPVAKLHLVPWLESLPVQGTKTLQFFEFATELGLILDNKAARFPHLRTINISAGPVVLAEEGAVWNTSLGPKTCGPEADDDETATERQRCTPANHDGFLYHFNEYSKLYTGIATSLAENNILLVSAAGNESLQICAVHPITTPDGKCPTFVPIPTWALNPFALLERRQPGSPFIDVEAHTKDLVRSNYSNIDALVSAPADGVVVPRKNGDGTFGWGAFGGTSAAAPFVTALAGYLAAFQPELPWSTIKKAILDSTIPLPSDDSIDRIDAYGALLHMPRGLEVMLDQSTPSPDGNRRVVYDDHGTPLGLDTLMGVGGAPYSAPDHLIDMRDFRRFRDAYLHECASGDPGCPVGGQIDLDGPENHPLKDGNLDRCSYGPGSPCDYSEGWFSRFDFNGDGTLLPQATWTPIDDDGTEAEPRTGIPFTDLDVFKLSWPELTGDNYEDLAGYEKADLEGLLSSADVEVRLDQLWARGATEAEVSVYTLEKDAPERGTFVRPPEYGDSRIFTVPLTLPADGVSDLVQVRVKITMEGSDEPRVFLSNIMPAEAGSDLVVTPCVDQLTIAADDLSLPPGGHTTIRATLKDCDGNPLADRDIDYLASGAPLGAAIEGATPTDAHGVSTVTYRNPEGVSGRVTIEATFNGQLKGDPQRASVTIGAAQDLALHYHFRQSILDYERHSTNNWPGGGDDCDSPIEMAAPRVEFNCFESTQIAGEVKYNPLGDIDTGLPIIERKGTIKPDGSGGALLTEEARIVASRNGVLVPYQQGAALKTTVKEWKPGDPASERKRVYDSWSYLSGQVLPSLAVSPEYAPSVTAILPDVHFTDVGGAVEVSGLETISKSLIHEHEIGSLRRGALIDELELHPDVPIRRFTALSNHSPDFTLGPRSDGTGFKTQPDERDALVLPVAADGTVQAPAPYCARVDQSLDGPPGYWNDTDPQVSPTIRDTDVRHPTREPGDRAAPLHTGHLRSQFEFSVAVTKGDETAEPPPFATVCPDEQPGVDFSWSPEVVHEGEEVTFQDDSVYAPTARIHFWDFGDGTPFLPLFVPKHTYTDNVTYPVTMQVVDASGQLHESPERTIEVQNAAPSIEIAAIFLGPDLAMNVQAFVDDPSVVDRTQLELRLSSPTPGFPRTEPVFVEPPADPANPGAFLPGKFLGGVKLPEALQPGVYTVVMTVLDKDGGSAHATMSLSVSPPSIPGSGAPAATPELRAGVGMAFATIPFTGPDGAIASSAPDGAIASSAPLGVAAAGSAPAAPSAPIAPASAPGPVAPASPSAPRTGSLSTPAGESSPDRAPAPEASAGASGLAVPAFVIDDIDVATAQSSTIRNVTRADGAGAAATLDAGDERAPVTLATGATTELSWLEGGAFTVTLEAGEVRAGVGVTVTGPPVPPVVTYEGPTSAAQGAIVPTVARVTSGPNPVPGVTVRFTLLGTALEAITEADGRAHVDLPVVGAAGATDLTVTVLPDTTITVPFTVIPNQVPAANAGGPYAVAPDTPLELHGSATDSDAGHAGALVQQWDLDGDGAFDDAAGAEPTLTANEVRTFVCGGSCDLGDTATVAFRVTDPLGGTGTATAVVTLIRDFAIGVTPGDALLVPNASVSFTVSVTTTSGFDQPVQLSTVGLPAGITTSFDHTTVTPNGTAVLTVHAGPGVANQNFSLVVRGTSGALERTSSATIDLEFGLIPVCKGTVEGHITDRETGAGIPGVGVLGAVTDADGYYRDDQVALDTGNSPVSVSRRLNPPGYIPVFTSGTAGCGIVTTMDATLLRERFGSVEGTVTGVSADGLTPLGPVVGSSVVGPKTDANGRYHFDRVQLGADNAPQTINLRAVAPTGSTFHASAITPVTVNATETTTQDFVLRQWCTASIRVQVIDARTKRPFPRAWVGDKQTDELGVVVLTGYPLGAPDNRPRAASVTATTPDDIYPRGTATKSVTLSHCGGVTPVTLALTQPHSVVATVDLTVVDEDTNAPIPFARTSVNNQYFGDADANGRIVGQYLLGVDVAPDKDVVVNGGHNDYWSRAAVPITLHEGQTTTATIKLQRKRKGIVQGVARDKETGAPLAGMVVGTGSGGATTAADGSFRFEHPLGANNTPVTTHLTGRDERQPPIYWSSESPGIPIAVSADGPTTQDVTMLRICHGATVRGRVVNAATGDPLEGVLVSIPQNLGWYDLTDGEGRFTLPEIAVGAQNQAQPYTVRATKDGFVTATKNVTVFCGADIVIDFGRSEGAHGTIAGRVTDASAAPVAGAFVGTGFGGSATTAADGTYTITDAPLADDGSARDWPVTVTPPAGSPLPGATKTATVVAGATTTVDFVLVEPENRPPSALDLTYATEQDQPVAIVLAGSDLDGDPMTFAVAAPPAHGSLAGTPPLLSYTPTVGYTGPDTFTFTASDGVATSAPATVTIGVALPNQGPTARIDAPDGTTADEGSSIVLDASASTDADGSIAGYQWDLDGDGDFGDDTGPQVAPRRDDDGGATVQVRVTDDDGAAAQTSIALTWTNVAPQIEGPGDSEVDAGDLFETSVYAEDPGDDELTGTVDWGDGGGAEGFDVDEGVLAHVFAGGGAFTATIEVCDDDGGCASASFLVTVFGPPVTTTTTTTTTMPTTTTSTTAMPTTTSTTTTSTTTTSTTTTSTTTTSTTTTSPTTTSTPTTTTVPSTTTTVPTTTTSTSVTSTTSTQPSTTTTMALPEATTTTTATDPTTTTSSTSTSTTAVPPSGSTTTLATLGADADADADAGGEGGGGGGGGAPVDSAAGASPAVAGTSSGAGTTTGALPATGSGPTLPVLGLLCLLLGLAAAAAGSRRRRR